VIFHGGLSDLSEEEMPAPDSLLLDYSYCFKCFLSVLRSKISLLRYLILLSDAIPGV